MLMTVNVDFRTFADLQTKVHADQALFIARGFANLKIRGWGCDGLSLRADALRV